MTSLVSENPMKWLDCARVIHVTVSQGPRPRAVRSPQFPSECVPIATDRPQRRRGPSSGRPLPTTPMRYELSRPLNPSRSERRSAGQAFEGIEKGGVEVQSGFAPLAVSRRRRAPRSRHCRIDAMIGGVRKPDCAERRWSRVPATQPRQTPAKPNRSGGVLQPHERAAKSAVRRSFANPRT